MTIHPRRPDYRELLTVLERKKPSRPVLFEFIIDPSVLLDAEAILPLSPDYPNGVRNWINAFAKNGYDYVSLPFWHLDLLRFPNGKHEVGASISQNEGAMITDWASYEAYPWPDASHGKYERIEEIARELPDGMKFLLFSPSGVLENLIGLTGYDNLCYLLADDPDLVQAVCDEVGSRLLSFYEYSLQNSSIAFAVVNDDWGYKTQTMLSPRDMRSLIFPWHKKIVDAIHRAGRPAILHSCGQMAMIWDDIIDQLHFDAKHSYEDGILPVEDAYEQYGNRIAILGGMDIDFLCRSTPDEIYQRSRKMIERSQDRGGYALGSGNSIPYYIPRLNYQAMRNAALDPF
ncbi:MAG: uroporphyrinogen decarboxylase family protein [Verrucomicrobiota bacterium]|nr:uroporphyrinogen decarboxylase family protein [Verrucomicrobiota bacterium]